MVLAWRAPRVPVEKRWFASLPLNVNGRLVCDCAAGCHQVQDRVTVQQQQDMSYQAQSARQLGWVVLTQGPLKGDQKPMCP